jgi:hypothetical protein
MTLWHQSGTSLFFLFLIENCFCPWEEEEEEEKNL